MRAIRGTDYYRTRFGIADDELGHAAGWLYPAALHFDCAYGILARNDEINFEIALSPPEHLNVACVREVHQLCAHGCLHQATAQIWVCKQHAQVNARDGVLVPERLHDR